MGKRRTFGATSKTHRSGRSGVLRRLFRGLVWQQRDAKSKKKNGQRKGREGKKGGKNQIFRWKDQYNRMHLQICRINAYSAVAARVSTRTTYSLFLLAGGWRSLARARARAFHPVHCTRSTAATPPFCRALGCARVGGRARASRLRNHVSEENLAAGYFLKIRDFKIRVGKQPPLLDSESGHP